MGAMCGKSQHFEGEGYQLNTFPTPNPQSQPKPKPKPINSPNPKEMRERLAKAAESREIDNQRKAGSGKLSDSLAQQKRDGNKTRVLEAIELGHSKGTGTAGSNPLVWD